MYKVFVQMPLALYDDQTAIVEMQIELADEYVPMEGQWLFHDVFDGLMPLGPIVYDSTRNSIVLTTIETTCDFTRTLEEWLSTRSEWQKAEKPFIMLDTAHQFTADDFAADDGED
jgi:hypothetical protein